MKRPFNPFMLLIAVPLVMATLMACKDSGPRPSDMVGNFKVTGRLKEGTVNKSAIRDSINNAMKKASEELKKAKKEMTEEMDVSGIDTTTAEGKIEYAAKQMAGSFSQLGEGLGDLTGQLGEMVSGVTVNGLDMAESIIKNLNISVELQEDGDIKSRGSIVDFGLRNAKWEVKDGMFLLYKDEGQEPEVFKISQRSSKGFILEKDKFLIDFVKEEKQ